MERNIGLYEILIAVCLFFMFTAFASLTDNWLEYDYLANEFEGDTLEDMQEIYTRKILSDLIGLGVAFGVMMLLAGRRKHSLWEQESRQRSIEMQQLPGTSRPKQSYDPTLFPIVITCHHCNRKIRVRQPGRFRCPICQGEDRVRRDGSFGPRQ